MDTGTKEFLDGRFISTAASKHLGKKSSRLCRERFPLTLAIPSRFCERCRRPWADIGFRHMANAVHTSEATAGEIVVWRGDPISVSDREAETPAVPRA